MKYSVFLVLLLAISEPLLACANKVVLVIPQQTRRSGPAWKPVASRFRKSSHGGEAHRHRYYGPPGPHYPPKKYVYKNPPFPHGGDDFDQGHEQVNHVHVPYGKDISHAVSYGKGYVPYDQIKGSFSFGRERHPSSQDHKHSEPEYAPTSYPASGSEYTQHSHEPPLPETFFTDPDSALNYNEQHNDHEKFYSSRSIEKDLLLNNSPNLDGTADKDQLLLLQQKANQLYKNVGPQPQGAVLLPSGVPSATIGGSKQGIVLRDTVALDEYQQKLQEMTKAWPQFLPNVGAVGSFGNNYQSQQVTASYSTGASPASGFSGSLSWPTSFAQPKQGYDVKEDTMEPPHDFRTMPIQTSSAYPSFSVPVNLAIPGLGQTLHG